MIQIEDKEKRQIDGHWKLFEQEQLQFIPNKKWLKRAYHIAIDSRLEDAAGNNLYGLLDQIGSDENKNTKRHQILEFRI